MKSFLCCISLFLLVLVPARAEGDYFLFVRQWDPTVCKMGTCSHTPDCRFTIHGLWPEYFNDTWPQYCNHEGFDPALVADLEPVLRREWPSVYSSNSAFWKHEWRKHGTCAEGLCPLLSDEHSFFFAVLALNKMYNLNTVMSEANITLETPHEQWWVENRFQATFKYSLAIHCFHEHHSGEGKDQKVFPVFEVWMCFDKYLQPFDCPDNVKRKCHGDVIFPALEDPDSSFDGMLHGDSKTEEPRVLDIHDDTYDDGDAAIVSLLDALDTMSVLDTVQAYKQLRQDMDVEDV